VFPNPAWGGKLTIRYLSKPIEGKKISKGRRHKVKRKDCTSFHEVNAQIKCKPLKGRENIRKKGGFTEGKKKGL